MGAAVKNKKTCPVCKVEYKQIAQHWRWNPEHRPNLTNEQYEIIVGVLMGDGSINFSNKNPSFAVSVVTKDYLDYLHEKFDYLSTGVSLCRTAQESVERNRDRKSFPSETINPENYSDLYKWMTCGHPQLREFITWYGENGKTFPDDISLTSTILTHWYVCDGHYQNKGTSDHLTIAVSNESENHLKLESYFKNAGLPEPRWKEYERDDGSIDSELRWTVEDSYKLWDYMKDPIPGFEYKWPNER